MGFFNHSTSVIDDGAIIGDGTRIWHFAHISKGAIIGKNCNIGQNCFIGMDVVIGNSVKIQNNVSIYTGTLVEDEVFLGPSCVLTNVSNPRSQINRHLYFEKIILRKGCTIGANATIVCGIEIGRYAFIGAGTVVNKSVRDYELITGVPGKKIGWMSRHGHRLDFNSSDMAVCPESGYSYQLKNDTVKCLDIGEETALPESKATGAGYYRDYKKGRP